MPSAYRIVWQNPWVRVAVGIGCFVLLCLVVYFLRPILIPLLVAFLVAYIFDPAADFFERRGLRRIGTALGLVFVITMLALSFPIIVIPGIIEESEKLIAASRGYGDTVWTDRVERYLPVDEIVDTMGWREGHPPEENAVDIIAAEVGQWIQLNAVDFLRKHGTMLFGATTDAGQSVAGIVTRVGDWFMGLLLFLGNFVLFVFVTIYLLKDYDVIIETMNGLIPPRFRAKIGTIMMRIDHQLRSFLRGQFMVVTCLGIMYAIGFVIADVLFAIPLALFGAIASFVPYLGAVLTIGPACLLTLFEHGFDWHILAVIATFAVAQFMEGNILTPRIVGSQVGLGPVWVILAILVFSASFGFIGLLIAVPLAAALKVLVMEALVFYKTSTFFEGPPPSSAGPLVAETSFPVSMPAPAEVPPPSAKRTSSRRKSRE